MHSFNLSEIGLDESAAASFIRSPESGAEVIFTGIVRSSSQGKKVLKLEFEAYTPMVLREMEKMALELNQHWKVNAILLHHRTGIVYPGEPAVIAAIASTHRREAFEACAWLMDTLKKKLPIWKKEFYEDGAYWVSATP